MIESVQDNVYLLGGKIRDQYADHCCLYVHDQELAMYMKQFRGRFVTMRYWVNDRELRDVEHATELTLEQVMGAGGVTAKCYHNSSEVTGYLYTTEEAKVGGHDLIAELEFCVGKFLLLEITLHEEGEQVAEAVELTRTVYDTPAIEALMAVITGRPLK